MSHQIIIHMDDAAYAALEAAAAENGQAVEQLAETTLSSNPVRNSISGYIQ